MKTGIILALALITTSSAFAGGWASSGGGSYKDQHNPWFLRNVPQVQYCISIDSSSFSASLSDVRAAIQNAVQYWQAQFATVGALPLPEAVGTPLATQSFVEVDCASGKQDIQFNMGYGTLNPQQIAFFQDATDPDKNVTSYIGVSVRTDYDSTNLKGKGFVYISSDSGPHMYQNDGNLIAQAWTKPHLLQYALIHEMGHVFGFPHLGSGIMSEVFLEQMLDQHLTQNFQNLPIEPFMFPGTLIDSCQVTPQALQWLSAPVGSQCLQFQIDPAHFNGIQIFSHTLGSTQLTPIGSLRGISISYQTDSRASPGVFVHLTSQQTVFTPKETNFSSFVTGPSFVDFGAEANFVPASGAAGKPVYLHFTQNAFTMTASGIPGMGTKLSILFSYQSWIYGWVNH